MRYESYRYLYPPRPKNAIPPTELAGWDDGTMLCQLKFNGSNCLVFTNGQKVVVMNRHGARLTGFRIPDAEILSLYKGTGGWTVLNGEYMNKAKRDERGAEFNHRLVVFDILVDDGEYLVGQTFEQRVGLLDRMFGQSACDREYLYSVSESVYRVKSHEGGFQQLYETMSRVDMIEGLVLKRRNARLEIGNTESNNTRSQVKCRKGTLNYRY